MGVVSIRSSFFTLHFISHSPFCCSLDVLASRSPLSGLSRSTLYALLSCYLPLSFPLSRLLAFFCSLTLVLFRSAARSLSLLTSHTFTKTLRFQLHTADSYGHGNSSEYGALLMRKTNAYRPPRTKALVATIRRKAGDYAARPSRCDQDRRQTLLDQDCRDENCRQDRHAIVIMLNT